MADSDEAERLAALRTTVRTHTGAQFESGEVYRRRGLNEPAPGVVPEPAGTYPEERQHRQPQAHGTPPLAQGRMDSFFGKRTTVQEELVGPPGRKRPKKFKEQKQMMVRGKMTTIYVSDNVVEDPEWVVITDVKDGNNHYTCVR